MMLSRLGLSVSPLGGVWRPGQPEAELFPMGQLSSMLMVALPALCNGVLPVCCTSPCAVCRTSCHIACQPCCWEPGQAVVPRCFRRTRAKIGTCSLRAGAASTFPPQQ